MSTTDPTTNDTSPSRPSDAPVPPVADARRPGRLPSKRVSAAAAALTLGIGVAIGAAVGPAPPASFAGATELPGLLGTLLARGASAGSPPAATAASEEAGVGSSEEGGVVHRRRRHRRIRVRAGAGATAAAEPESSSPSSPAPTSITKAALKPVTSVWLIELTGESFSQALAQPAAAPYIASQLVPAGTLETTWSALDGSAFASDVSLSGLHAPAGSPSPILEQVVQPPCPEGSAGTQCEPGTPGELTTADDFVKQTVALISANALYKAHGLIVVTFGSKTQASAAGLPEGATSATLTAQPPAGVLLLSPFIRAGARSTGSFDSTSPARALRALLGK